MNQKRKAELQRKLSMMPVPKPPVGLADRIKADIPDDLARATRRSTPASSPFMLRIAASVLIVAVSSALLTIYFMSGSRRASDVLLPATAPRGAAVPLSSAARALPEAEVTVTLAEAPRKKETAKPAMVMAEAKQAAQRLQAAALDRDEQRADSANSGFAPSAPAPATPSAVVAQSSPGETGIEGRAVGGIAVDRATNAAAATPSRPAAVAEPITVSQSATAVMKDAAAERPAERRASVATKTAGGSAKAESAPREMFGISMDPDAFGRIQKSIEGGKRPAAASVDVEAIVNYFAGARQPPRHGVNFEVEASRPPVGTPSRAAMVRFTIETAAGESTAGSDATLDISFNDTAVASHRVLGNGKPLSASEPLLFNNFTVTAVIAVDLNSGIAPHQEVAKLRLRYREPGGREQTVVRVVRANDLQRNWSDASRRHRLATLGAIWSEGLKRGASADVTETAEELARESPGDVRARELADAASASSQLSGRAGSAGSGSR